MWTPAYPDRHPAPVPDDSFPSTCVDSAAFSKKLLKWGKKKLAKFSAGNFGGGKKAYAQVQITFPRVLLSGSNCNVIRQHAGGSRTGPGQVVI